MTILTQVTAEDAGFHPGQIERIRERANEWIQASHTQSLVLLAARRGKIALYEAFGKQNYDDNLALDRTSMFASSSVSKVITATAIMMLVEDGALSLNRLVKEYFPELEGKYTDRMLVHQLLTHTSGFADLRTLPIFVAPDETDVPCPVELHPHMHKVLQTIAKMDCHKKPGELNMYSNENFTLLGEIIRRVSGKDVEEYSRQYIFGPLGMKSSTFGPYDNCAAPVSKRDPSSWPSEFGRQVFENIVISSGSLKTNAMDLAVFGQAFLNGGEYDGHRLLNEWTVAEMTRNQIPGVGSYDPMNRFIPEGSWGLGWMVQGDARWPWSHGMLQPRGTFFHQGATGCSLWVDPIHELVGVYLSVTDRDFENPNPIWEFDKFQNMVTAAVNHAA